MNENAPSGGSIDRLVATFETSTQTWSPLARVLTAAFAIIPAAVALKYFVRYLNHQLGRLLTSLFVAAVCGAWCPSEESAQAHVLYGLAGLFLGWLASGTGKFKAIALGTLSAMALLAAAREIVLHSLS